MSLSLLIPVILLILVIAGIFSYRINAGYQLIGNFVAGVSALLLFLMAIGVFHV